MEINSSKYRKIVIKIGSSLIVDGEKMRSSWIENIVSNIHQITKKNDCQIVLVSSGAVALGRIALGYHNKKLSIQEKQVCASVGQIELMTIYKDFFKKFDIKIAQILLTATDCNSRKSYLNSKNTIEKLLDNQIIPIINENDSVAVDEIKIGDNDRLSARVAQMIGADLMILFSDIDGLYDKNPKEFKTANLIQQVDKITKEIEQMARGSNSLVGTGGMITKIMASKMAMSAQCSTIITSGIEKDALKKLIAGNKKYTIFKCSDLNEKSKHKTKAKLDWLSGFVNAKGSIIINENAVKALKTKKASLLAIGAIGIEGVFSRGEAVFIKDESNNHIASGIVNYNSNDAKKILQKNSKEIIKIMGPKAKPELIHIDNIVIINF
ncbi:MAG: glutamate 5-kinase [Proteobacteria bacterium]|nr:glutamate 5-kinase [Pseudomonadota bacterium]